MSAIMIAEQRNSRKKSDLKRLRSNGQIPGVLMGLGKESENICVSSPDFQRWLKSGAGLVELQLHDARKVPALLEGVQRDSVTGEFLHVDFLRVNTDEAVRAKVPIEYIGTPKGTKLGGILQTQSAFVEVEALPHQLPSSISMDISDLDIGDSLLVEHIVVPSEVKIISLENELLVSIVTPKVQVEAVEEE